MFTDLLADLPPGAEVDVTDDLDAVAIWRPPGSDGTSPPPPHARQEVVEMFGWLNAAAPAQPFWYLMFLGARTGGAGGGTALMGHRAERSKAALWTDAEANVRSYERHGFHTLSRHEAHGMSAWWLWRAQAVRRPDSHEQAALPAASAKRPWLAVGEWASSRCAKISNVELLEAQRLAKRIAEQIVSEEVTPYEGARRIWTDVWSEVPEQSHELDSFVNEATDWEEMPERRAEIETSIRSEATRLFLVWPD